MKKLLVLLLSSLILLVPVSSMAAPSPLIKSYSAAILSEEENIQLISYKAYLKVDSDITESSASFIIKNTSEEEKHSVMAGIPSHINQGAIKIDNLQVVMDGVRQRLTNRRDRTQQEDTDDTWLPSNWYTWMINLDPGEYKVIDISYTTKVQRDDNGTHIIYIPLDYLSYWYNIPENVEVTVDFGDTAPYVFEPNPSALPHQYDNKGRLTWIYNNTYPPENIQLFYRPIEQLALEYISQQSAGKKAVSSIINSFINKSYSQTISSIDEFLESQEESTLTNEMIYLKALSLQELHQTSEAVKLFDQLEKMPMFGELEGTFKNKIIYDKYANMKYLLADEEALFEYLDSSKNYVMDNAMFLMWIEEELNELSAFISPEEEPEQTEEETLLPEETEEEDADDELVRSVTIGNYEISVELLFLIILAVVIILTTIISRRRKRKYRSRGYYFR